MFGCVPCTTDDTCGYDMQLVQMTEARFKVAMMRAPLAEMFKPQTSVFPDYTTVAACVLAFRVTWSQYKAISAMCNSNIPAEIKFGYRGVLPAAQTLRIWCAAQVHAHVCSEVVWVQSMAQAGAGLCDVTM
jgi:hypothetical protein